MILVNEMAAFGCLRRGIVSAVDNGANWNELRYFSAKMVELAEDQMSELAAICREAGLEALFKTSMKIYGRQEVDNGGGRKQR
jgi:predicted transglutaminase-like cysteine proteinase